MDSTLYTLVYVCMGLGTSQSKFCTKIKPVISMSFDVISVVPK